MAFLSDELIQLTMDSLVDYNGKPVKLNDLWQDFLQGLQTKDTENHQDKHVVWDFSSDKISPIEISDEILLKSKFVRTTPYGDIEFCYSKEDSEYYCTIRLRPRRNEWVVHAEKFNMREKSKYFHREFDGNIKYIHELQLILTAVEIDKKIII